MKFNNIPKWEEWKQASSSFFQLRATKPALVKIDLLIRKYHQVFDMSKLNVLSELKTAIEQWAADKIDRNAATGRLEAMQALEEVVIRKLYELDGWGKHKYLKVICIGFDIETGYYDENRSPANLNSRQMEEKGDMVSRCNILKKAITDSYGMYRNYVQLMNIPPDEERKILKIFMAPEFFFRGPYGAYRDIGLVNGIFDNMRSEIKKAIYTDWLFVHGSAIISTEKSNKKDGAGILLENFALAQKGGLGSGEYNEMIFEKEFPSSVDYKHPGISDQQWYNPALSEARIAGVDKKAFWPEGGRQHFNLSGDVKSELIGGCIFTLDGIRFGLEVCLDHGAGRLAQSKEKGSIQIQLIPSCGMNIDDNHIACVPDGIVFNVDGMKNYHHVNIKINNSNPEPRYLLPEVPSGGGKIRLYEEVIIPRQGLVRADIAQKLNISQNIMSGKVPIPPPKPAVKPVPAGKPTPPPVPNKKMVPPASIPDSVKKFGVPLLPPNSINKKK